MRCPGSRPAAAALLPRCIDRCQADLRQVPDCCRHEWHANADRCIHEDPRLPAGCCKLVCDDGEPRVHCTDGCDTRHRPDADLLEVKQNQLRKKMITALTSCSHYGAISRHVCEGQFATLRQPQGIGWVSLYWFLGSKCGRTALSCATMQTCSSNSRLSCPTAW